MADKKTLVDVLRENPECIVTIDNDCWWITRESPKNNPFDVDGDYRKHVAWDDANHLANDDTHPYGHGGPYGGDILVALAEIVGIELRRV